MIGLNGYEDFAASSAKIFKRMTCSSSSKMYLWIVERKNHVLSWTFFFSFLLSFSWQIHFLLLVLRFCAEVTGSMIHEEVCSSSVKNDDDATLWFLLLLSMFFVVI
jgi:hypothetical protein